MVNRPFENIRPFGPFIELNGDDAIELYDSHFDLTNSDEFIYHIAHREDIPDIISEGLVGSKESFAKREQHEVKDEGELMGPEDAFGPGIKAAQLLNEALAEAQNVADSASPRLEASDLASREDSVFFFETVSDARNRVGDNIKNPVIIAVNSNKIPCVSFKVEETNCVSAPIEVADELFEMFYDQAKEQAPVNREKEQELADEYWNRAFPYQGGSAIGGGLREIFCSCDIPTKGIEEIAKVSRIPPDLDRDNILGL